MAKTPVKTNKPKKNDVEKDGAINIPIKSDDGLFLSALHPKYLHTNSTSHTWPFSAVAELIDNAYDPDVNASQLFIDLKAFKNPPNRCLVFTDNGNGMSPNKLYKMLSFGFCEKVAVKDHLPVGHYGNGFKSGSMRLGKDALVFTKTESRWSLGFLSQTYLEKTGSDTIIVPIVTWDPKKFNLLEKEMGGQNSLTAIQTHSVLSTVAQIQEEFRAIEGTTGTRIIVSNLRRQVAGNKYELDFVKDCFDIRIPDDLADSDESKYKREQRQDHIPASDYSLRAYCSILYLKPRMQIILRGKKVKTTVVAKSLAKTEVDMYRPFTPTGQLKPVKIVFGFSQNKNHYGIMMYHRNRLIKPYVRVGHQEKQNALGIGVIGVIECDFLQPTHNKQDFDYTKAFRACMIGLGRKLNEYWQEKKSSKKSQPQVAEEVESDQLAPDQKWVQCDNRNCLKWRMLPDSVDLDKLPEKWYCKDHPLEEWRSCDVPEHLEIEAKVKPYTKEIKRQLEKEKKQKRQSLRSDDKATSDIASLAEKSKKELENERKKRLLHEQTAKEQAAEIQRLTLELQKSASVPANLDKQGKTNVEPRPASAAPGKQPNTPQATTPQASNQMAKNYSTIIIVTTAASSSATKTPTPTQGLSKTPSLTNTTQSIASNSALMASTTASKTPAYPTRQSINKAIKVRLPFTTNRTGKGPITIAPNPLTSTPIVRAILKPNQQSQAAVRHPTPVTQTISKTILPQNIRISPLQVKDSTGNLTTLQNATLPKVLTLLRFTDVPKQSASASSVITKTLAGAASVPTTVKAIKTVRTPVLPVSSAARVPQNTTTKVSTPQPTSHDINQQLAQIGIDAIAAQTEQDVKPVILNPPPTNATQHTPETLSTNSIILTNKPINTANGSFASPTRESKSQITVRKRPGTNDDIKIVNEIPAKKTRNEGIKDGNSSQQSNSTNSSASECNSQPSNSTLPIGIPKDIEKKTDQDVVDDIKKLPANKVLGLLAQRSQQLRDLRQSVCKLLGVLVPDLDLPDAGKRSLDDNTIDVLLKDVLDANTDPAKE
eukprot:gene413-1048_t